MPEPIQFLTTYGQVRARLAQHNLGWSVDDSIADDSPLPIHLLGGPPPQPADPTKRVNVLSLVAQQPPAWRLASKISLGVLAAEGATAAGAGSPQGAGAPQRPASVDWRTRNGWATFTKTRDQGQSEHCWIFGPTGVVEAMTRIEHCIWAPRSEGDVVRGLNVVVGQCGDAVNTLNWVKNNGQADPGCIPWPFPAGRNDAYWLPSPKDCGGGSTQHTTATPTFDRSGRTVKTPAFTTLNNVEDMKNWIWQVGPTVASSIEIYNDFFAYSNISTVYTPIPNQKLLGTHVLAVVGYDDARRAWLVRNSWGDAGWGSHGYGWIGYGQIKIDTNVMYGVRGTNPDPWSKRFNHNGAIFESGDGANHNNFEMFVHSTMGGVGHWWRDNGNGAMPWAPAANFASDVGSQVTATGTTFNRNFELIYRSNGGRLRHWYYDQSAGRWNDGATFGPTTAVGTPGFVQSHYGPGNFEVVTALSSGKMQHWWRDGGGWHEGLTFGPDRILVRQALDVSAVRLAAGTTAAGAVQKESATAVVGGLREQIVDKPVGLIDKVVPDRLKLPLGDRVSDVGASLIETTTGHLELVCLLNNGTLQHWSRADGSTWAWSSVATFASNCRSAPVLIEGQFARGDESASGNYELVVALNDGTLQHWWRGVGGSWQASATFGSGIDKVMGIVQGSFGFNLEVVARRQDGTSQHLWRDGAGWHQGVIIGPAL